jgi:hypothetical protein
MCASRQFGPSQFHSPIPSQGGASGAAQRGDAQSCIQPLLSCGRHNNSVKPFMSRAKHANMCLLLGPSQAGAVHQSPGPLPDNIRTLRSRTYLLSALLKS